MTDKTTETKIEVPVAEKYKLQAKNVNVFMMIFRQ